MGGQDKNSPTTPSRVRTTVEDQWEAVRLRAAGASFREIGQALDCDHTWARKLVLKALEATEYEQASLLRNIEGMRLDRLQRSLWPQALGGDVKAANTIIRIMQRRAALFGLDAPTQVEVTQQDQEVTAWAERYGVTLTTIG